MILAEWRAGRISAEVALARLVLAGGGVAQVAGEIAGEPALLRLFEQRRDELARLEAMLRDSGADHGGASSVARVRALFDKAVQHSPEASVAAYSLGDPATLARATEEIVAWLDANALLDPDGDALDLGCGIGRIAAALAGRMRSVLGIDISPGMIGEAGRRHGDVDNLRFETTEGTGLAHLGRARFTLVLAVDSIPYLMQVDPALAERHVCAAHDLLVANGNLAVFNLSYSGDLDADRARAADWAARYGYALRCNGERPFRLWDGAAFVFSKAG